MATTKQGKRPKLHDSGTVRAERLASDPEFRAYWERTAFARELSLIVLRKRNELGLTIEELAAKLNVDPEVIGVLEDGEEDPPLRVLDLLSRELGIGFTVSIDASSKDDSEAGMGPVMHTLPERHAKVA
jgi:ribosome-binding protein aMBF1 (putative translation factor)